MRPINVLSLFDGMSCGRLALERAGIPVANYYASEIDKHAIAVTMKNYPDTIQLGCIKEAKGKLPYGIDLLIGGSPCQGFSFAGKQLNFDDPRSALFFDYVEILNELQPEFFLLENVKMKKEYEQVITDHLGVDPVEINSNLVSAQNRKRLYWTSLPELKQPEDRGIFWGDVREHGVIGDTYYYTEAAMQWLGRYSRKRHKTLDVHQDNEKMQMLEASHHKKYSQQRFFGIGDMPENPQAVAAMRGKYLVNGKRQDGRMKTAGLTEQRIEFRYDGKTNSLTTVSKDNVAVPFTLPHHVPASEFFFRYITPTECERLQTVPDGYTECVSNTQRYRMLGNGWTVDVIAHILEGMKDDLRRLP